MIETFCSGYALEALTDLGAFPDEGFHTARDIAARIGLPERYDQLLPRLLENWPYKASWPVTPPALTDARPLRTGISGIV